MGQFDAGLAWLIEMVTELGLADPEELAPPQALAHPDWIAAAARTVADAYDEDGELIDEDAPPRLSPRSLETYLQRLKTVFDTLGCDVAKAAIGRLLDDPKLKGHGGMSPGNIAFCKAVVTSPAKQAILFGMPWAIQARAQALLDEWDTLSSARRYEAVRAGSCAVAMLLLTRCAPVRIANLAAITFRGGKPATVIAAPRWHPFRLDAEDALLEWRVAPDGIRAIDRWLVHLDRQKAPVVTSGTVLSFFGDSTSPGPIARLLGALIAVRPTCPHIPAISEAHLLRQQSYQPARPVRARSRTPKVSVERHELPAGGDLLTHGDAEISEGRQHAVERRDRTAGGNEGVPVSGHVGAAGDAHDPISCPRRKSGGRWRGGPVHGRRFARPSRQRERRGDHQT